MGPRVRGDDTVGGGGDGVISGVAVVTAHAADVDPHPIPPPEEWGGSPDCETWARSYSVSTVMAGLDPATQITQPTRGPVDKVNLLGPRGRARG